MADNNIPGAAAIAEYLKSCLEWLEKSFAVNRNEGSSAWRHVLGCWSGPYPETTGYLIPTLLDAGVQLRDARYLQLADRQVHYFARIQNEDGSFPLSSRNHNPNVFDTSQILLGLLAHFRATGDATSKQLARRTFLWLMKQLSPEGKMMAYNLHGSYNPSYYTRICWALLLADRNLGSNRMEEIIPFFRTLDLNFSKDNIINASFAPGKPAYSHTIIYALRGYWECARLIEDNAYIVKSNHLLNYYKTLTLGLGKLPGRISREGAFDESFTCTTGNLQLALLLLKVPEISELPDGQNCLAYLLNPAIQSQQRNGPNKGAVPSSIPIYGSYQRFRYTNWTQKFYCDVLLSLLKSSSDLKSKRMTSPTGR